MSKGKKKVTSGIVLGLAAVTATYLIVKAKENESRGFSVTVGITDQNGNPIPNK